MRQGCTGAPAAARGKENEGQSPLPARSLRVGRAHSLYRMRAGVCPGVRPEGRLRCSAHPLGGAECRRCVQLPAFAPGCSEVAVVLLFSLYLLVHNLPQLLMHAVIFTPSQFLCICCLRRRMSRYKHGSKGSQVPACLNNIYT